jgi:hypothetical protein
MGLFGGGGGLFGGGGGGGGGGGAQIGTAGAIAGVPGAIETGFIADKGGIDFQDVLDPLDLGGGKAAKSAIETAERGVAEQRRQFDTAQQNVAPFIQASVAQIPGLEQSATTEGMIANLLGIQESIPQAFGGVVDARGQAIQESAARSGLDIPPEAIAEISQLPPDVQNALVFDIEQELNRRSQELFAPGTSQGIEFGRLGAQAAGGIGNTLTQGLFDAQGARAAGQENLMNIGGGIAGLLSGNKKAA